MHIKEINISSNSNNISFVSINCNLNKKEDKLNIYKIKTKEKIKNKCKICEEDITKEEEMKNKCEQCGNYFCSECLYLHIKELIRNGKYALFCPECKFVYKKNKIDQILLFNVKNKEEINNLKKLLEKSNIKEMILSNPELMFCPIVNCEGFAKKNDNEEYNICTMGHKFCIKCGELWHEEGKCQKEKEVDELFQKYSKKYQLKNCPYCHIVTIKNGGCNHMKCQYCGKHWCWICQEIFDSTEEHYGNRRSKCYNQMNANYDIVICSKCENEINQNQILRRFKCGHIYCENCFNECLLENNMRIIFPEKLIACVIIGCKDHTLYSGDRLVSIIQESNNVNLIKKYKATILFYQYLLLPLMPTHYGDYLDFLYDFYDLISKSKVFNCCYRRCEKFYDILRIVGIIFGYIFIPIYLIIVPISIHYTIIDLYYYKFLIEFRKKYDNKLIIYAIVFGEIILSLVFAFPLIAWHYIYTILFFPILFIVLLIRNRIYKIPMNCC